MISRFFSRSLRNSHRRWKRLEATLQTWRQELAIELQKAKMAAQRAGVDAPEREGILKEASQFTSKSLPKKLEDDFKTINSAFAILGKSLWRATPPSLKNTLDNFETGVKERGRYCDVLSEMLCTVHTVLDTLSQKPVYAADLSPWLVLWHPEIAEDLLQLAEEQWENRQVSRERLQKCFHKRLAIGRGWLRVLQNEMSSYRHGQRNLGLDKIEAEAPPEAKPDLDPWLDLHQRLDKELLPLNQLGVALYP